MFNNVQKFINYLKIYFKVFTEVSTLQRLHRRFR
jgi:hypothetical protein